jgi:hypothetical protein
MRVSVCVCMSYSTRVLAVEAVCFGVLNQLDVYHKVDSTLTIKLIQLYVHSLHFGVRHTRHLRIPALTPACTALYV